MCKSWCKQDVRKEEIGCLLLSKLGIDLLFSGGLCSDVSIWKIGKVVDEINYEPNNSDNKVKGVNNWPNDELIFVESSALIDHRWGDNCTDSNVHEWETINDSYGSHINNECNHHSQPCDNRKSNRN